MNNDILTEERIDNYLLGRMSNEEKLLFEADLERDISLREEYESQKQVANAVQKVAMREFLAKHAEDRKLVKSNVIDLSKVFSRLIGKVKDFFSSGQRVVWALATVATMVVAVVGGINYSSTINNLESNGLIAYADLTAPIARDGNRLDVLIEQAYLQIGNNEWDAALSSIKEARTMINTILSESNGSEEDIYQEQLLQLKEYDLDWFNTIIQMERGKLLKAKRSLEEIASSDSPYSGIARNMLESIF